MSKYFIEVIAAKGFDREALSILKKKKNLRLIDISKYKLKNVYSIKNFDKSFVVQNKDKVVLDRKKLKCVTKLKPTKKELAEIEYAFNISKLLTCVFGGMLTFQDKQIAKKLRAFRDEEYQKPSFWKAIARRIYLLAIYPAFNELVYGFVWLLQEKI